MPHSPKSKSQSKMQGDVKKGEKRPRVSSAGSEVMPDKQDGDPLSGEKAQDSFEDYMKQSIDSIRSSLKELVTGQLDLTSRMGNIEQRLGNFDIRLASQGKAINVNQEEINDMKHNQSSMKKDFEKLKSGMERVLQQVDLLQETNNKLERFSRKNNLRLIGVAENKHEDCIAVVSQMLIDKFGMQGIEIERAHRVGKFQTGKTRQIIFRLLKFQDKLQIFRSKPLEKLKGTNMKIKDDLSDADQEKLIKFQPAIEKAKVEKKKWRFFNGKLYVGEFPNQKVYEQPTDYVTDPGGTLGE